MQGVISVQPGNNPEYVHLTTKCPFCGARNVVTVLTRELEAYKNGVHIQQAFPSMDEDDRELIQTGMDNACFDDATLVFTD